MTRKQIVGDLARTRKRTLAAFGWPAKTLARSYGSGKWTAKQILGHLTDCELVFLTRLQYMLAEENPTVVSFEQDFWARRFDYAREDLGAMRDRFGVLRGRIVELAKSMNDGDLKRTAQRPDHPDYTIEYLLSHAAEHNDHHLEQLEAIKAGRTWTPRTA